MGFTSGQKFSVAWGGFIGNNAAAVFRRDKISSYLFRKTWLQFQQDGILQTQICFFQGDLLPMTDIDE